MRILLLVMSPILLGGCVVGTIASTAVKVATLPVKAVSAGIDAATTSKSEADEKRGGDLRRADEQRARDARRRCKPYAELRLACPHAEPQLD